jgi:hypothetical protein
LSKSSRRFLTAFLFVTTAVFATACGSDTNDEEETEQTSDELKQGGCSMQEIRKVQAACRSFCGSFGSRGIAFCYPGQTIKQDFIDTEVCRCKR